MKDHTIECAIIDDEKIACDRLNELLNPFKNIQVISMLTSYEEAIEFLLEKKPILIFLDVELDNCHTAFELIDELHNHLYKPIIILVTAYDHYSIKGIKKGVFDYLLKPIDLGELKNTILRVESSLSNKVLDLVSSQTVLSNREQEVLQLVLQGKTSKEIADELFISINTVNTHRKNLLKKAGVHSIIEFIRKVGITP